MLSAELLADLACGDDERAEAAVMRLAAEGEAALPVIQALLASQQPEDVRWWAARALAEIPGPTAQDLLLHALNDAAAGVRQCAVLGLRKQPQVTAIPRLIQALFDPDGLCADIAADTLAVLGSDAVPALLEVATQSVPPAEDTNTQAVGNLVRAHARLRAVKSLALIGDPRAIPVFMALLQDDSALTSYWANEGLDRMGLGLELFDPR
jgi:HEAT repeat protein